MELLTADISLWRFPASLILGAAFLLGIWAADRYWRQARICRLLSGAASAVVLICLTAAALVAEGIWAAGLFRTWPFIALILTLMASLGLVTLQRWRTRRDAGFLLNHAGMLLILWGGLFGAPDVTKARMLIPVGQTATMAYTPSGEAVPLGFGVRLDRFTVEYYDDGSPRLFRSEVHFDSHPAVVEVNSPARYGGYTFYQDSYDTREGRYTILLAVRDPWLWIVWAGVAMLAAGSITLLLRRR